MIHLCIVVPLGEPATIEVRPKAPEGMIGPPLPIVSTNTVIDAAEFMRLPIEDLVKRYATPMLAHIRNMLGEKGF